MTMRKKKRRKEGAVKQVGDEAGIGESRQNIRHSKTHHDATIVSLTGD
jgi:hypothetical protein